MPHSPFTSSDSDHYCRLFLPGSGRPDLEDEVAVWRFSKMLAGLVERMNYDGTAEEALGYHVSDAGYTYFGQLVDHDLTQDITDLQTAWLLEPQYIVNYSSAKLDLDNLYGNGPEKDPYLYEADKLHFKVSPGPDGGDSFDVAVEALTRPKPGCPPCVAPPGSQLPPSTKLWPLIADPRTTENLIIRQMVAVFARLHNVAVDELRACNLSPAQHFERARRKTVWTYQWLIVNDYLWHMLDETIYKAVFKENDRKFVWRTFSVPVEFAVASMRFGHSMVRGRYELNAEKDLRLQEILARSNGPGTLEKEWKINWGHFFLGGGNVGHTQLTHQPIDTQIAAALHDLFPRTVEKFRALFVPPARPKDGLASLDPFHPSALPLITLMRGAGQRLASGQNAAVACGETPLSDEELTQDGASRQGAYLHKFGNEWLRRETPLWYYILREAEVQHEGDCLGRTGSRIVGETIYAALEHDPDSILNQDKALVETPIWQLQSGDVQFPTLSDLFAAAYRLVARQV